MTYCFRCKTEVKPVATMIAGGSIGHACPTCSAPIVPDDEHPEDRSDVSAPKPVALERAKTEPKDVVTMVRERRAIVAKRIEELRQLETELAQLDAMLSAVDALAKDGNDEAVPVLRPVRAAR